MKSFPASSTRRFLTRALACGWLLLNAGCSETETAPNDLKRAVANMWKDAEIGTDAEYAKVARHAVPGHVIAPRHMREVATSFANGRSLRKWPNAVTLTWLPQGVRLSWSAEGLSMFDAPDALALFDIVMQQHGYQVLHKSSGVGQLEQRFGLGRDDGKTQRSQNDRGYTRKVNRTEVAVFAEAVHYTGGEGVQSGVQFRWHLLYPIQLEAFTLAETLQSLPPWFRADYLPPQLYEEFADEPILEYTGARHITIRFTNDVAERLVETLEGNGFAYHREHEPRIGVQKTWFRYTDLTYAHVTTFPDSRYVRFHCQAPQHDGPPKEKPPALHPSLQLPLSKRPIVAFEQLTFADDNLQRQTRMLHDVAERIAEEGWFVQGFKDTRYSAAPQYVALWETAHVPGVTYHRTTLPYQGIEIRLAGDEATDIVETLTSVNVRGSWVPSQGWGATIHYRPDTGGWARVGLVDPADSQFSFQAHPNRLVIGLPCKSISVGQIAKQISYRYQGQLPNDLSATATAERRRRFFKLYASPESLRDVTLEDIDALRKIATEQIQRSDGISVTEYTYGSSSDPPQPQTVNRPDVPDEIRQQLLAAAMRRLGVYEQNIREDYRAMHAALVKALPLNQLRLGHDALR